MLLRWCLEPAILSAILVSPGTGGTERINDWAGNQIGVVVRGINVRYVLAELNHGVKDVFLGGTLISEVLKRVTEKGAVAILDTLNKDVSVVVHKVSGIHAL